MLDTHNRNIITMSSDKNCARCSHKIIGNSYASINSAAICGSCKRDEMLETKNTVNCTLCESTVEISASRKLVSKPANFQCEDCFNTDAEKKIIDAYSSLDAYLEEFHKSIIERTDIDPKGYYVDPKGCCADPKDYCADPKGDSVDKDAKLLVFTTKMAHFPVQIPQLGLMRLSLEVNGFLDRVANSNYARNYYVRDFKNTIESYISRVDDTTEECKVLMEYFENVKKFDIEKAQFEIFQYCRAVKSNNDNEYIQNMLWEMFKN